MRTKRFSELTLEEKIKIHQCWRSGHYYNTEICEKFAISEHTLKRVIDYFCESEL